MSVVRECPERLPELLAAGEDPDQPDAAGQRALWPGKWLGPRLFEGFEALKDSRRSRCSWARAMPATPRPVTSTALRHLQLQVRRLEQWKGPSGELLSLCSSVLDWVGASCLEEAFKDAVRLACLALRKKIGLKEVRYAVREYLSSLLYVALMSEGPKEARQQLAEVLREICGARGSHESSTACQGCQCKHMAIQEALSLFRVVHSKRLERLPSHIEEGGKQMSTDSSNFMQFHAYSESYSCFLARTSHFSGLLWLLELLCELLDALHEPCFLERTKLEWWTLYQEIRRRPFHSFLSCSTSVHSLKRS